MGRVGFAPGGDESQGNPLLGRHRYAEAEAAYREELPRLTGADAADVQFQIAVTLQRRYLNDRSIEEYLKVAQHDGADAPLRARALLAVGQNHQQRQRYDEALAAYTNTDRAQGALPETRALSRLFAAYTWNKMGERDKAIEMLESVTEIPLRNPTTHQQALLSAGKIRQEQRRYAEAGEWYRKALALGEKTHVGTFARNGEIECRTALTGEPTFFFAPYVSLVSSTEATLFWVSREGVPAGRVTLTDPEGRTIDALATLVPIADRDEQRQTVQLTGLAPYTLYRYTADSTAPDGSVRTAAGYFHTARDQPGPTRFVTIGDTQTGWEHHAKIAPLVAAEKPDFVLHVGDCVDDGPSWDQWKVQMFDPGRPYLSQAPVWVARGNHDGGPYFPIIFGREQHPWISFTFGDLHVMILESTFSMGVESGSRQLAWLDEQFQSSTSQWSLIALHHCLFHTATGDTLVGQTNFRPLIEKYAPDLVLNGHYHKYSRQLPTGLPGKKPLINIVTGGAGGGNGTPSTRSPIVEHSYESFHYCLFEIDGNRLSLTAKDIEGQVIDRMTLVKQNGLFQDEVQARSVDPATFAAMRLIYDELKFPNYARVDWTGQLVTAEGKSRVRLDRNVLEFSRLPADTMLVVEAPPESKWTVPSQTLNLSRGELEFAATPPAETRVPLRIIANVRLGDRLFVPREFTVTLRPAAPAAGPAK